MLVENNIFKCSVHKLTAHRLIYPTTGIAENAYNIFYLSYVSSLTILKLILVWCDADF